MPVYSCGLFLFQSSLDTNIHDRSPTKGSVGGGWVELPPTLPPVPDTALLCPTFAQFSFRWSLDTEEDDEYNRWRTKLIFKNRVLLKTNEGITCGDCHYFSKENFCYSDST